MQEENNFVALHIVRTRNERMPDLWKCDPPISIMANSQIGPPPRPN